MRAEDGRISQLRTLISLPRAAGPLPPIIIGNELVVSVAFTFASGYVVLGGLLAGSVINRTAVRVDASLNPGATLSFGITANPNLFSFPLDAAGQFEDDSLFTLPTTDLLVMTVSPNASSAGGGILFYKVLMP